MQTSLLRVAGVSRRLALALSLTETTRRLALRGIRRALATTDDVRVRLRFVELHYGRELADAVRSRLPRPRE